MSSEPDPITTHVLDQTTGHPAANLQVLLSAPPSETGSLDPARWVAYTAPGSGRITQWSLHSESTLPLKEHLAASSRSEGRGIWTLTFHTGEYWGEGSTFYPEVVVKFFVDMREGKEHWHVPLLLGPYGYTTYRGT